MSERASSNGELVLHSDEAAWLADMLDADPDETFVRNGGTTVTLGVPTTHDDIGTPGDVVDLYPEVVETPGVFDVDPDQVGIRVDAPGNATVLVHGL